MSYLDSAYFRFHIMGGTDQSIFSQMVLGLYGEIAYAIRASTAGVPPVSLGFGVSLPFIPGITFAGTQSDDNYHHAPWSVQRSQ